ncbi:MAG: UvrD-helicase domain-containing protein, partial [Gammaproteobacteria bacterium]|nr:UvrD-helicase domain-containing protein [Gammaproteobacteria bacterium]
MSDLNPRQQQAVQYLDGPLLVLAGAGSGKTRVITSKIVHLIEKAKLSPSHITAVTFTNKA